MKKSPVKVIVRMRPTSNFAYHNMNVDEESGYSISYLVKLTSMLRDHWTKVSSTIPKTNGAIDLRKF